VTLSIAGRCAHSGQLGVAISSSSPAVAARCAWVRAGVGAVCTQNITDPRLGTVLLDSMATGASAPEAMTAVVRTEPLVPWRQLTAIDRNGLTGTWSGDHTLGVHAVAEGHDCVAAGNLLLDRNVPDAMVNAFAGFPGQELGDRLLAALTEGLREGGEVGPVHSAGLVIVSDVPWPVTDLRVDWSEDPIADLNALWRLWRPQAHAYRLRALDPAEAPSYGVPGDENRP
jgi:uncharacterized Ntn-hydrolase superfamily protein